MIIPRWKCWFKKNKLEIEYKEKFQAYLESLKNKGDLELIIRRWKKTKTIQQLRYLHGIVFTLASETSGYTPEEIKGLLKAQFLTAHIEGKNGRKLSYVKSLADLEIDEMAKFIDDCIILCAKHWGCVIPSPEEVKI
jgi:hypothetical protein